MPKNVQTTIQLCSFHMLARVCLKSSKLSFSSIWTKNFQVYKLDLEKVQGPDTKLPTSAWNIEKAREFQKNIWFIDCAKAFDSVDHKKLEKFFKRWEYQTTLPASWETCMQVKKQQLELDMEQWTGSKLGKVYVKAVYCHPACLTYMQSTSCKMPGWKNHKLKSRFPGEMSITSDIQKTPC